MQSGDKTTFCFEKMRFLMLRRRLMLTLVCERVLNSRLFWNGWTVLKRIAVVIHILFFLGASFVFVWLAWLVDYYEYINDLHGHYPINPPNTLRILISIHMRLTCTQKRNRKNWYRLWQIREFTLISKLIYIVLTW